MLNYYIEINLSVMKKIKPTLILLLITFGILNAQEVRGIVEVPPTHSEHPQADPSYSNPEEEVISLPIYPGCETIADQDRSEVEQCFRNTIRTQIHNRLMMKTDELAELGLDRLTTIVSFVVSKEGCLTNIQTESGNSIEYRKIVEEQMKRMAANFPEIIPAKIANGEPVNYLYRLPVTFVFVE